MINIEWDRETWYSKTLAIIILIAIFFVGFGFGSLYQQIKDYSTFYSTAIMKSNATSTNQAPGVTNTTPPINNKQVCVNNSNCPTGYSCLVYGPIISGQQPSKFCTPPGQAVPQ